MRTKAQKEADTKYVRVLEEVLLDTWAKLQVCLGILDPSNPDEFFPKGRIAPVRRNLLELNEKVSAVMILKNKRKQVDL